jgi:hypothetical protein
MRKLVVAILCLGGSGLALGSTEAHALGWYRTHGDYAVAAPGCYHFRSPRWNYAAAYYQTYSRSAKYRRGHVHRCGCRH